MSALVGWNVKQQYRVISCRLEINVAQVLKRSYLTILRCVIEPSRTNRYVNFRWIPMHFCSFGYHFAATQVVFHTVYIQCRIILCSLRQTRRCKHGSAPFCFTAQASFVAYPSYVVAHNSSYRLWLQTMDSAQNAIPVIFLFLSVRTFTIGTVKPYFVYFAIVGQQFCKLFYEEAVISRRISVAFSVSIPR